MKKVKREKKEEHIRRRELDKWVIQEKVEAKEVEV